jgi:hypothetical protein
LIVEPPKPEPAPPRPPADPPQAPKPEPPLLLEEEEESEPGPGDEPSEPRDGDSDGGSVVEDVADDSMYAIVGQISLDELTPMPLIDVQIRLGIVLADALIAGELLDVLGLTPL